MPDAVRHQVPADPGLEDHPVHLEDEDPAVRPGSRDATRTSPTTRSTAPAAASSRTTTSTCSRELDEQVGRLHHRASRSRTSGVTRSRTRPTSPARRSTSSSRPTASPARGCAGSTTATARGSSCGRATSTPRSVASSTSVTRRGATPPPTARTAARSTASARSRTASTAARRRCADYAQHLPTIVEIPFSSERSRDRGRRRLRGHLPARPSTTSASTGRACCGASQPVERHHPREPQPAVARAAATTKLTRADIRGHDPLLPGRQRAS